MLIDTRPENNFVHGRGLRDIIRKVTTPFKGIIDTFVSGFGEELGKSAREGLTNVAMDSLKQGSTEPVKQAFKNIPESANQAAQKSLLRQSKVANAPESASSAPQTTSKPAAKKAPAKTAAKKPASKSAAKKGKGYGVPTVGEAVFLPHEKGGAAFLPHQGGKSGKGSKGGVMARLSHQGGNATNIKNVGAKLRSNSKKLPTL